MPQRSSIRATSSAATEYLCGKTCSLGTGNDTRGETPDCKTVITLPRYRPETPFRHSLNLRRSPRPIPTPDGVGHRRQGRWCPRRETRQISTAPVYYHRPPLAGVNRVFGFQHASFLLNQTCNLPDGQDASHIPVQGKRPVSTAVASCESGHGDELRSSMPEAIQVFASQSQDLRAVFPIPTELRGSPTAHQGFPISVNGYSDIPRAGNLVRIGINSSRHGTQCTGFHVEFNRPRLDSCKPRI